MRRATPLSGLGMIVGLMLSLNVEAQDNSYTNTISDVWQTANDWSLGAAPSNNPNVFITNATTKTVTIDSTTPSANLTITNLTISGPSGTTNTLSLTNGTGLTVLKVMTISSNGVVTITNSLLQINNVITNNGTINLLSGGVLLETTNVLRIGAGGLTGTMTINGGAYTNGTSGACNFGTSVGSSGIVLIISGTLAITNGTLGIGNGGNGVVTISNGTMYVQGTETIANNSGSSGFLEIDGGSNIVGGAFTISDALTATGTVLVTGGELQVTNSSIAIANKGRGTMTISNGNVSTTTIETVGNIGGSSGTLTVIGGSNTIAGALTVGSAANATGTVLVAGGTLAVTNGIITNGFSGIGTVTISNGTISALGFIQGSTSGSTGTLNIAGGTIVVTNSTQTASFDNRRGTVTMNSGTLITDQLYMTNGTSSVFTFNGGTVNSSFTTNTTSSTFNVGDGASIATLNLLTGAHYFNSGLNVQNNATLTVSGTVFGGLTTVSSGGTLNGTGTVGFLNNQGNVLPGTATTPGTLFSTATYTQAVGGTLTIDIASLASYGRLNITSGFAALGGAFTPTLLNGYSPSRGDIFNGVLVASGGISNSFATLNNAQITSTLKWQLVYNATNVNLLVIGDFANPTLNLRPEQRQVADALNALSSKATGDLSTVLNAIGLLGSSAVGDAYTQISATKFKTMAPAALSGVALHTVNLRWHLNNLRTDALESYAWKGEETGSGKPILLAFSGTDLSGVLTGWNRHEPDRQRWNFFLRASGTFNDQETTLNQPGFGYNTAGFAAGMDYKLTDEVTLGFDSGYSNTAIDLSGSGGKVDVDTFPFGVYGSYHRAHWYLHGLADYSAHLYETKRNLQFGTINRVTHGDTLGHQGNVFFEGGYEYTRGRWSLVPTASIQYTKLWIQRFAETGAESLNLQISDQKADSLQSGLGGRLIYTYKTRGIRIQPQIQITYQHEFAQDSRIIDARLTQGSEPFQVQTESANRNFGLIMGGVNLELSDALNLNLNYQTNVGQNNFSAHAISAGVNIVF